LLERALQQTALYSYNGAKIQLIKDFSVFVHVSTGEGLMNQSDTGSKDVVSENTELIHRTVMAIAASEYIPDLENLLEKAESNGWTALVAAIRKILEGERDLSRIAGLDEEDRLIVTAILRGIVDPSSLPDLTNVIDPAVAAPSMAAMIQAAAGGNPEANEAIKLIGEQMVGTNDDFSRIPEIIHRIVIGERRKEVLSEGLGPVGASLVHAILDELGKLEI